MNNLSGYLKYYTKYYNNYLKSIYNLSPKIDILFHTIKGDAPANTTFIDNKYLITYDSHKIFNRFPNFIKLIAGHEVCHVYDKEIHEDDKNGGHNEIFFNILALLPGLGHEDYLLTKERHIIPWKNKLDINKLPSKMVNAVKNGPDINKNFYIDNIEYYFISFIGDCILCDSKGVQLDFINKNYKSNIEKIRSKYKLMPDKLIDKFYRNDVVNL